jgi:hypothetical protein
MHMISVGLVQFQPPATAHAKMRQVFVPSKGIRLALGSLHSPLRMRYACACCF